jgi:NOL1/NOP2/fmu family ribosome biogenesis protein
MALSYLTSDFWQGNKLLLNNAQALQYYKGESLPIEAARGLTLLQYQANEVSTLNLGWANSLGNRLNNHWPKAWRIRMDLPAHPTETD